MTKFIEVPLTTRTVVDDPGSILPPHPIRYKVPMTVLGSLEILFGTVLFINGCLLLSQQRNQTSFFFGPPFALIAVAGGITAILAVRKQSSTKVRFTFIATILLGFIVFVACLVGAIVLIQLGLLVKREETVDIVYTDGHSLMLTTHTPRPLATTLSPVEGMAFFISSGVLYIMLGLTACAIILLASLNLCCVKYVTLNIVEVK
ncbi:uncharacterized protein LOC129583373 [Paramacrobiotus metropolitanus]|uniref:uncharacterized protein LOC129583373 n=1 Tax=Paramacrobiotus metropolitanus TaxID=2943436 RepID=UPI002445B67B|nr:uncharacterized protein LOC129583373 [Paramacrobiotus metropolitanus]